MITWAVVRGKFDRATWQLLASAALTGNRMREEGIGTMAVEQRIEYKRELLAGDRPEGFLFGQEKWL